MNSMELVRFPARTARPAQGAARKSAAPPFASELIGAARNSIVRARHFLVTRQQIDGLWIGRQTADVSLASQLIFLFTYLDREDSELIDRCASAIASAQLVNGGWPLTPDGRADVSTSVQAYFALKLVGYEASDRRLCEARETIRELGGADAADYTTRFFLALLGQLSYDFCPMIPPEMVRFDAKCGALYAPLSILWSHRSVHSVGIERGVRELFVCKPCDWSKTRAAGSSGRWVRSGQTLFTRMVPHFERRGWTPLRRRALNRAERQLHERVQPSQLAELDFHELIWHSAALHTLGYPADSPERRACDDRLREVTDIDDATGCARPRLRTTAWGDTALVVRSLMGSGMLPSHAAIQTAIDTLSRPPARTGTRLATDACNFLHASKPPTAAQQPDSEDGLPPDFDVCSDWRSNTGGPTEHAASNKRVRAQQVIRSLDQILQSQNIDGGWGPSINSRSPLRSSEPDSTGAVLEALTLHDFANKRTTVNRAVAYLRLVQEADGSWRNSNGSQEILCTANAVRGLAAAGISRDDDSIAAAINWLVIRQERDGAWNANVTETAWAVLALVSAGMADQPAVRRGIAYLIDAQDDNGGWTDENYASPDPLSNHFLQNELHAVAWPLLAISEWTVAASSSQPAATDQLSLRLVAASPEI